MSLHRLAEEQPTLGLPYADRIAQLEGIDRDKIVEYYRATHVGNNTCIVLAGDFRKGKDIESLTGLLSTKLKDLPKGKERARKDLVLPSGFAQKVILTPSLKKTEGHFALDFINSAYTEDVSVRAAMRLFSTILGGGSASRLYLSTRLKGLSYGPYAGYHFDEDFSEANLSDRAVPTKLLPLFKECVEQAFVIVDGDYTDAELERARGYERGGFQTGFERPSDLAGWYANNFVWRRDMHSPDDLIKHFGKVTREDIAAVAKTFFQPGSWVLSLRAPEGSVNADDFRAVIESASS